LASSGVEPAQRNTAGLKLAQVLPFLKRWLWLILVIAVIPPVVIGGRLRATYTAIAMLQMTAPPGVDVTLYQQGAPYSNLRDDLTVARTDFIQAAYSPEVRKRTLTALGLANADPAYLVNIQPLRDSDFIIISVDARTGQLAAATADAHAEAAISYASELRARPAQSAVAFLTEQLQTAQAELEAAQSAAATPGQSTQADQNLRSAQDYYKLIQGKLGEARLKSNSRYSAQAMQIVDHALAPISPNDRKVQTQLVLFALGGLVAGVLIAMLLDRLARKAMPRRMLNPVPWRKLNPVPWGRLNPVPWGRLKPVLRRMAPSRDRALDVLVLVIGVSLGMLAGALLVGMTLGTTVAASLGGHS
jgi:uncharacterized protein involved in exopolysaccharide biosynthesis